MTECECAYPDDADCPVHGDVATRALTPTYTAAEVKVLTETARQETADRIAAEADRVAERYQETANHHRALSIEHRTSAKYSESHFKTALAFKNKADGAWAVAQIARDLSSLAAEATSDATSGVPGHQEVSEAVRSPQEPCEDPDCPTPLMHTHSWLNATEGNTQ